MTRGCSAALLVVCLGVACWGQPFVAIDSLDGKAEVKRAGSFDWTMVSQGAKLYNNDLLRVHGQSGAKLAWPLKNLVVVRANSQIRINLVEDEAANTLSQHVTVFFGALFFVVEKALPKELGRKENLKVYTPTTIISIRGTSFMVEVAPDSGTTHVMVTNGSLQVQNSAGSESILLQAGMQTVVSGTAKPYPPSPILSPDIDSLKQWVPPPVVDSELARSGGLKSGQVEKGTLRQAKILVVPFELSAEYEGDWDVARGMAHMVARQIEAVYPQGTTDTSAVEGVDPVAQARTRGYGYALSGKIKEFRLSKRAFVDPSVRKYRENALALVAIHLVITDIVSGKTLYDNTLSTEFTDNDLTANSWAAVSRTSFSSTDPQFMKTILGKAVLAVVSRVADTAVDTIAGAE